MSKEENPFKKNSKLQESPVRGEKKEFEEKSIDENLDDDERIYSQNQYKEQLAKTLKYIENKKKFLNDNSLSVAGATAKHLYCIECTLDTKDLVYILCEGCNKRTHIECVKHDRFDIDGNYFCTKCSSSIESANQKIYAKLKSELVFFIANHEEDEKHIPYEKFVHKDCGVTQWPNEEDIDNLAFQISDEHGKSLICLKCDKIILRNSALSCKGCLTLYHAECCLDLKGEEVKCPLCYQRLASNTNKNQQLKKRLMRKRVKKIEPQQEIVEKKKSFEESSCEESCDSSSEYEDDLFQASLSHLRNNNPQASNASAFKNERITAGFNTSYRGRGRIGRGGYHNNWHLDNSCDCLNIHNTSNAYHNSQALINGQNNMKMRSDHKFVKIGDSLYNIYKVPSVIIDYIIKEEIDEQRKQQRRPQLDIQGRNISVNPSINGTTDRADDKREMMEEPGG